MIAEVGRNLVALSLVLSLYTGVSRVGGIRRRDDRWAQSAQRGLDC